ncbi:4'-phosphopantetheinyl transferase family protein [Roseiflexus sp.]|uniref:4'-phosphopantetheinyl transferase family protein n=1 Tax=Roseiflexus sp. TaxID=2562120 RepID=UPI00398AFFE9
MKPLGVKPDSMQAGAFCAPDAGDVHVWIIRLDRQVAVVRLLWGMLSDDERARALRFRCPRDQDRFIVAHAALRSILSGYLSVMPSRVRIRTLAYGKPAIDGDTAIRFNLSHSGDLALCAIAGGREIGVDVEQIRPDLDWDRLARCFFSADEVAALEALEPKHRLEGFLRCWTRKEAYLKARGEGLALSLDSFTVLPDPEPSIAKHWQIVDLKLMPAYVAALAVEGHVRMVRYNNWGETLAPTVTF